MVVDFVIHSCYVILLLLYEGFDPGLAHLLIFLGTHGTIFHLLLLLFVFQNLILDLPNLRQSILDLHSDELLAVEHPTILFHQNVDSVSVDVWHHLYILDFLVGYLLLLELLFSFVLLALWNQSVFNLFELTLFCVKAFFAVYADNVQEREVVALLFWLHLGAWAWHPWALFSRPIALTLLHRFIFQLSQGRSSLFSQYLFLRLVYLSHLVESLANWCCRSSWSSCFQIHQISIQHFDLILQLFELRVGIDLLIHLLFWLVFSFLSPRLELGCLLLFSLMSDNIFILNFRYFCIKHGLVLFCLILEWIHQDLRNWWRLLDFAR